MPDPPRSGRPRAAPLVAAFGVLVALVVAPEGGLAGPAQDPTIPLVEEPGDDQLTGAELKEEYDEVLGQEAEVLEELLLAQQARQRAAAELAKLEQETTAKQFELLAAQEALVAAQEAEAAAEEARAEAEAAAADARERLRRQVVASYVAGGEGAGVGEAMLRAANGEELGTAITFGEVIVERTDEIVEDLEEAEAAARRADQQAEAARERAATERDTVSEATAFLTAARDEQADLVAEESFRVLAEAEALQAVQGRRLLVEGRINAMTRTSDGITQLLAELQADQEPWTPGSVVITNPLPGRTVSSKYGMRRHPILGITRLHAGGDIGAPSGTEMHAAADGVVVLAGPRGGFGNTVVIDHGTSLATLYAHASQILVQQGDLVQRGDVIALVGSTGLSTSPHLHLETRVKGLPIDPEGVIDFEAEVDYDERDAEPGGN